MADWTRDISCELVIDDYDGPPLRAAGFDAEEALSAVTRVHVGAVVHETVDPEQLLGRRAYLRVDSGTAGARSFYGLVTEAEVEAAQADVFILQIEIRPRLALLALGRNTRLYQQASVKDVVQAVLEEVGLRAGKDPGEAGAAGQGGQKDDPPDQIWAVRTNYPHREYVLQRGESDLDFISRLLEEEGLGFAVHDGGDVEKEQVLFFDESGELGPIPGDAVLVDRSTTHLQSDTVSDAGDDLSVAPDKVVLRDYDFRRPAHPLTARFPDDQDNQGGDGVREVYRHPGGFVESGGDGQRVAHRETRHPKEPERLARHAHEQLRAETRVIAGTSDCPRLETGRRFELADSARDSANGELLIVGASHRGFFPVDENAGEDLLAYENDFRAIPRDVPWRPAAHAHPLGADGIELAFVTTPSGEEIHVDEFGRIKVSFPWDRSGKEDDSSSVWMRVGQPAVGGGMILPRGGFEVIVDFERGDVDRPFVSGHLYNKELSPPYELPAGKTLSTVQTATTSQGGTGHELRFEDAAGGEEVFLRSSRDFHVAVANDASHRVGGSQQVDVGGDSGIDVGGTHRGQVGGGRTVQVGADQNVKVGGDLSAAMGADHEITVAALRKMQVGGDLSDEVVTTLSRRVGALQSVTGVIGVMRTVLISSNVMVGGAWMELVGGDRASEVGGLRTETIGGLKKVKAAQISTSAGKAMATQVGGVDDVKCGGNRSDESGGSLTFTSGGGVSVKATSIVIEAADKLSITVGSCVIKLDSGGKVELSAPKVDLTGVEALQQLMHKSN
jgi:type VI secretion system secreted protein VgrG